MFPSLCRSLRLLATGLILASGTACIEHIETLITKVVYDPYTQLFSVEQRLIGIERKFLGCESLEECTAAIERAVNVQPDPGVSLALGDRLLQRLIESGAVDVSVEFERVGDRLDATIQYAAPVGSAAADDTLVRVEWRGRKRGHYYLVVTPQDSMTPPRFSRTRKVARGSPSGLDWVEEWVLPRWTRKVSTSLEVSEPDPLFADLPALADVLEANGWLGTVHREPEQMASVDLAANEPSDTGSADSDPAPQEALSSVRTVEVDGEEVTSVALDPSSPAKTWIYPARISGGGLSSAAVAVSLEPLVPAVSRCYQSRQREVSSLEGSLFLSALVRADGEVVATSVNGSMNDPTFLACLDKLLGSWTFSSWGGGEGVSDVAVPIVFRLEKGGPGK